MDHSFPQESDRDHIFDTSRSCPDPDPADSSIESTIGSLDPQRTRANVSGADVPKDDRLSDLSTTPLDRLVVQWIAAGSGGVRDYAESLGAQWDKRGLKSALVALGEEDIRKLPLARRLEQLTPGGRTKCTVLLHFSGYGFQRRGLCFWLVRELEATRRLLGSHVRIVTVFHELFASGPPWRSAFWLSAIQSGIAAQIARLSDAIWTNTQHHAQWLREHVAPSTPIEVKPVFSNVGEPDPHTASQATRVSRIVVFGSASTRQRAFDGLRGHEAFVQRLGVHEIVEVGTGLTHVPGLPQPIRRVGRLAPVELSELLLGSRFGLIDYPPQYLGKSGVFAAYAAHGCVVINTAPRGNNHDGLVGGRDYHSLVEPGRTVHSAFDGPPGTVPSLVHWYSAHRLDIQASEIFALTRG